VAELLLVAAAARDLAGPLVAGHVAGGAAVTVVPAAFAGLTADQATACRLPPDVDAGEVIATEVASRKR
jgi:hypothetical protein